MAKSRIISVKRQKNINDKPAPKSIIKSLNFLQRLLVVVGKPFYSLLQTFLFLIFISITLSIKAFINFSEIILIILAIVTTQVLKLLLTFPFRFGKKIKRATKTFSLTRTRKIKRGKVYVVYPPKFHISRLKILLKKTKIPAKQPTTIHFSVFRIRYILIFFTFYLTGVAIFSAWQIITKDLPSPNSLSERNQRVSTKIYDRNGILLYNIYKDENRTPVPLDEIPLKVRLATLAIEDAEFYKHPGFSIRGILRALKKNFEEGELTGGSTITQQLIKNTLLTPEKTYTRKLREIILAVQVERTFSKDKILEMYLNEVSYGGTAYGIQEASRVYFGKDVGKLTLAEAAILAGLPKSPTTYSPFGANPELALVRQKEVLNLMKVNGFISDKQMEEALKEKITFTDNRANIKAPHFVMYIREFLENKYGKELVEAGGLSVTTTLDFEIQKLAESIVREEVNSLKKLNVGNGAALVINPKTGEILAMVGSIDYFDRTNDGNVNVALRPRQPGSSIKVVNYSYALSNGLTPATIINDSPAKFSVAGQPGYIPKNYDGKFRGRLTVRNALAESRNVPAVKVLASFGVGKMIEQGKKMGITTWTEPSNYGLSLTLGGGEVKLIDLAQVYAVIANYGEKIPLNPVKEITTSQGRLLENNSCSPGSSKSHFDIAGLINQDYAQVDKRHSECKGEQVLDPRVAYLLIDILKDNSARTPAFGSRSLLNIPGHKEVAVKTGTSNNLRDNLAIGFTQNYIVAVWVGNNDNSQMSRIASGVTGATPIFNEIMSTLLANQPNDDWPVPGGLVKVSYCTLTGTLPCEGCPTRSEWFLEETAPKTVCNPEVIKEILDKKEEKIKEPEQETQDNPQIP